MRRCTWLLAMIAAVSSVPAAAGPPFATDDPEPTDPGHWEIYGYFEGASVPGGTEGEAGLDINYGVAKDVQLTVIVPIDYVTGKYAHAGRGDVELGVKYLFLHQASGSVLPDVAFFPAINLPTSGQGFGNGKASVILPVWAQKDIGEWSIFGGGGYVINPGPGRRNYWLQGLAVSRKLSERFSLGAEVFHQGPHVDHNDGLAFTAISLGAIYKLDRHWSLLASGGPGIQNARQQGRFTFYAALKADL